MAEDQNVVYSFEVRNTDAMKRLGDFSKQLGNLEDHASSALGPLEYLGNVIKAVATSGDFNISEKSMKSFVTQINRAIDPATQLAKEFKEVSKAYQNMQLSFTRSGKQDAAIKQREEESKAFSDIIKRRMQSEVNAEKLVQAEKEEAAKRAKAAEREAARVAEEARKATAKRAWQDAQGVDAMITLQEARGRQFSAELKRQAAEREQVAQAEKNATIKTTSELSRYIDNSIRAREASGARFTYSLRRQLEQQAAAQEQAYQRMITTARKMQNVNNAGVKGEVNVDPATKSAQSSAVVFMKQFRTETDAAERSTAHLTSTFREATKSAEESAKVFLAAGKVQPAQRFTNKYSGSSERSDEYIRKREQASKAFSKALREQMQAQQDAVEAAKKQAVETEKLGDTLQKATHHSSLLKKAMSALSGVAVGKALASAVKEGVSMYETMNLFDVAMHDSIESSTEFIKTLAELFGLDPKSLMDFTGLFYEMAYAVSMPQQQAEKFSKTLTVMSIDLASLFNVPVDKVANNLMSGMRGMSRAVLSYGMDLRATTVEAYANAHGITQQFETMNEASREMLRFVVAVEQARDAQADWSYTMNMPANQLRILKEQLAQLGRAISRFLLEPLRVVLPYINGFIAALRILIDLLADFFGFQSDWSQPAREFNKGAQAASGMSKAVDNVGKSANKTKSAIKSLIAPFDELNVLSQSSGATGSGGGIGGIGGAGGVDFGAVDPAILALMDEAQWKMENMRLKAWDTRDAILAFFGVTPGEDGWVYTPGVFQQNMENLLAKVPTWVATLGTLAIGGVAIKRLIDLANLLKTKFDALQPVVLALKKALVKHFGAIAAKFGVTIGGMVAGVAIFVAGVVDGFVQLWKESSDFRGQVAQLIKNIGHLVSSLAQTIRHVLQNLWETFLYPLIHTIGELTKGFWPLVAGVLDSIVGAFQGVVDIIDGLMIGDMNRIFKGFGKIVLSVFEAVGSIIVGIANVIISAVVTAINFVGSIVYKFVSGVSKLANVVLSALDRDTINVSKSTFTIDTPITLTPPKFDYAFAAGGVVTGPTRALIGEAGRAEAVVPLDNSPQMEELISRISDATGPTEVHVYIGGTEWDAFTYKSAQRGKQLVGATPIMEGSV